MRRATAVAALFTALAAVLAAAARQEPFPHARHERLFPLCDGCHGDLRTTDAVPRFPDPESCARCHDGELEARVVWDGPEKRPSNVRFSHGEHRAVERPAAEVTCAQCHGTGAAGRMAVGPARADACIQCHAHEAPDHLAPGRDCLACHAPLTEASGLTTARIAAFPAPASHVAGDFAARHAPTDASAASCAVCHARDSCALCHANDGDVPLIAALRPDARVAAIVADRTPDYPEPADHADPTWDVAHGDRAEAAGGACANCHTRESCATCHGDVWNAALAALPTRGDGDARGVTVRVRASRVHAPGFARRHDTEAAARDATCASCHDRAECESCHVGGSTPTFHLPDFLATHGPAAYAADVECISCHSTEVFCRSCHAGTGLAARDQLGLAFHTANPFWLVGHGEGARQGLEICVTCHTQQSCMRCHAATGSWRISPHGPGFDAGRARSANPIPCRLCHGAGTVR